MFEQGRASDVEARRHIGRCVSCMACVTACPADVDFGTLIRHAKVFIHSSSVPTVRERLLNWFAVQVVPFPNRLRWLMKAGPLGMRFSRALQWARVGEVASMARVSVPTSGSRPAFSGPGTAATRRDRRGRVLLLQACAQQVLRPSVNDATIRLLARNGIDVEVAAGAVCCGAPASQIGDQERAKAFARANIDAWTKSINRSPTDALLFNSAGCGMMVQQYADLLRDDPQYATKAAEISGMAQDVTAFIGEHGLGPPRRWSSLKVAYQAPCQLHHGQAVVAEPTTLIHESGFTIVEMPESGMCCGAGGVYAFKEPLIAEQLRDRKVDHILAIRPDVVATGSISCLKHLEPATGTPLVHTVELLDWAHGGPVPRGLEAFAKDVYDVPGPPPLDVEDYIRVRQYRWDNELGARVTLLLTVHPL